MRISDWSSDVCSSDLQRAGWFVRPRRSEAARHPNSCWCSLVACRADGTGKGGLWILFLGPSRRSFSSRSEEHTSELQSLMRISYAVFCLKKKKKLNNTKPTGTPFNITVIQIQDHTIDNRVSKII